MKIELFIDVFTYRDPEQWPTLAHQVQSYSPEKWSLTRYVNGLHYSPPEEHRRLPRFTSRDEADKAGQEWKEQMRDEAERAAAGLHPSWDDDIDRGELDSAFYILRLQSAIKDFVADYEDVPKDPPIFSYEIVCRRWGEEGRVFLRLLKGGQRVHHTERDVLAPLPYNEQYFDNADLAHRAGMRWVIAKSTQYLDLESQREPAAKDEMELENGIPF